MSKLEHWDPEDHSFWERTGNKVASRNLLISIPNLLLGFSVWIYWGMVAKYIQELHFSSENGELFNFTFMNDGEHYDSLGYRALLFTLPAVAGLPGATLRIPNSFMIATISTGSPTNIGALSNTRYKTPPQPPLFSPNKFPVT